MLYRLQPEAHDDVIKLITNLSDNLKDRKLKVYHVAMEMLCCYGNAMLLWKCYVAMEMYCIAGNFHWCKFSNNRPKYLENKFS